MEEVVEQFHGARLGRIKDPFGYTWIILTTHTVMSQQEMQQVNDAWIASLSQDA